MSAKSARSTGEETYLSGQLGQLGLLSQLDLGRPLGRRDLYSQQDVDECQRSLYVQ